MFANTSRHDPMICTNVVVVVLASRLVLHRELDDDPLSLSFVQVRGVVQSSLQIVRVRIRKFLSVYK